MVLTCSAVKPALIFGSSRPGVDVMAGPISGDGARGNWHLGESGGEAAGEGVDGCFLPFLLLRGAMVRCT